MLSSEDGNNALKPCTVASPAFIIFGLALLLVHLDYGITTFDSRLTVLPRHRISMLRVDELDHQTCPAAEELPKVLKDLTD
jgi:hypothetical protein